MAAGAALSLPEGTARHVQVLRLQPGHQITLFNGQGGEWNATITRMGRSDVEVTLGVHRPDEREAGRAVQLALGMPANERMDWLVEKATELGAASVQALMTERTVVRLDGERARKKADHWLSIAIASCEQCGRNQVPTLPVPVSMRHWLAQLGQPNGASGNRLRLVLSFRAAARPLSDVIHERRSGATDVTVLSGPEGGLSLAEEQQALDQGFEPVTLGPRVLRSETAAMAALTLLG